VNVDEVFRKLKPVMGEKLNVLWQEYILGDEATRQLIERSLRIILARRFHEAFDSEQVLLEPPPREVAAGDYPLGIIHYGSDQFYPFGLRESEMIQHVAIFGRSGSGKTNLAYLMLLNLIRAGKPFLVFDWKRNYRDLLSLSECRNLLVFTVGRGTFGFRFNPLLPPPGTSPTVWLKKLIEIMCHAYFLGEGVAVLLLRAIDALYRERGMYGSSPYEGKSRECRNKGGGRHLSHGDSEDLELGAQGDRALGTPTMADVRDWLEAYGAKGREAGWMESAMRAVEVLCFGEVGCVLNSAESFDIAQLLEKSVVLELDALTNSDKTFLIESLLLWIHHYRMGQEDREHFKHAVFVEEAHHILLRKKQEQTGEESVTDVLLREIRELGECIICLDQHPSLISKPALGNTYTTFAMNLKHRGDIAMMKDCLLLDSEQAGYLGKLEVGWGVAKLQGRWFKPFLVRFPLLKLDKGAVTDEIIRRHMNNRLKEQDGLYGRISTAEGFSRVISAQESVSAGLGAPREVFPGIPVEDKREEKEGTECAIDLTTKEREFLEDVLKHETSSISDRYKRLLLSSRKGTYCQHSLLSKGFLSFEFVSFGKGRIKILSLTKKGKKALGYETARQTRHGGAEHEYWKKTVAARLKDLGYAVQEEYPIGSGKTIDLVASREGQKIAIEIETGKSDPESNARKCMDSGFRHIWLMFTNKKAKEEFLREWHTPTTERQTKIRVLCVREDWNESAG
jgi:hypothetical protein